MPNEGKSVEEIMGEFAEKFPTLRDELNSSYDPLTKLNLGSLYRNWLRSALSAVVLGAVERLPEDRFPDDGNGADDNRNYGYNNAIGDIRQALTVYAQEIAKDV